jgi:sodium transport system permease protein
VALVAVLFLGGGAVLHLLFSEVGIVMAEWLLLLGPVVAFVAIGGFDAVETLSLRRPRGGTLVAAAVLALGAVPLGWLIGWLQSFVVPVPEELLREMERFVTADSPAQLLWLLVVLALTPAVCEELVFRGVLLGGTRSLSPWRMIALNGAVFGAFHLSPATVVRFLPTAFLGMVIAWAVWKSGSIWIGALMHFVNNAVIVVAAASPMVRTETADPHVPPPLPLIGVAAVAFLTGAGMLVRSIYLSPQLATPLERES